MKTNYQSLEKKIDVKFKNKDLLIQALTHKSFNPNENNEKIEFLGDRVLGLVIAKNVHMPRKSDKAIFSIKTVLTKRLVRSAISCLLFYC